MRLLAGSWVAVLLVGSASSVLAAETKPETVLDGLYHPCGVAVQPGTGHVFVADSGAGRIIRIVNGKAEDVITGFPKDVYGRGPTYEIGPLGLVFFDKNTLVVGGGGLADKEELIRVYTVPAARSDPVAAGHMKVKLGPLASRNDLPPEGNFYGVAVTPAGVYATANGDGNEGCVVKSEINGTKFGELRRFIATRELVDAGAPAGITISPRGEVVVGQMGKTDKPRDSLVTFHNAYSGKMLLTLKAGLHDVTGVAYSPKTGMLYAVDFAWMAEGEGGLFRLDAVRENGKQAIKAVRIASLVKPAAMAFAPEGTLYVCEFGAATGDEKKSGKLVKVDPGL